MPNTPLVSICIPTYNGARWLGEALESALAQSYSPLEILVADDASTDDTLALARSYSDPRLRIVAGEQNRGLVGNWNRSVELARGEWVKFLFQDDLLRSDCVAKMVAAGESAPNVGLVFSRREILLEKPDDPTARNWKEQYGILDTQFERLEAVNNGRDLFEQYLRHGFRMNFLGEPTAVMVRREWFQRLGGFHTRMHQGPDFEMWVRVMFYANVAFLAEPLCVFRYHAASTSLANHRQNRSWLDMFWLLEGLLRHPEIRTAYPRIVNLRWREAARTVRSEFRRWRAGLPPQLGFQARSLREYLTYRLQALAGHAPALHGQIGDPP